MAQPSAIVESDYFIPSSKITVLINSLVKMSKNPSIESELSQVLDEFLDKLGECDTYLQNGIFNMNFAEAALLLQSSADLYSKKVDMLWDIIFDYQKRLLLSEEQNGDTNQEIEKVEERKRKYKRKRKTNSDESQTAKLVNNFSFGNAENIDYLNQICETVDLSKEWEIFHQKNERCDTAEGHILNKSFTFLPNNLIHSEDNDYLGRYDQFHSTSLTEEIFHLQSQNLLTDEYNCITKMRIDSYVINDFLLQKSIPSNVPIEGYSKQLKEYVHQFFESNRHPDKEHHQLEQALCKKSFVCLERLPVQVMRDKLRRASLADSLFDDVEAEICPSPCNALSFDPKNCEVDQVGKNLESRSKSCSQDSAFFEDEELAHNEDSEVEVDSALALTSESVSAALVSEPDKVIDSISTVQETVTTDVNETTNIKPTIDDASAEMDSTAVSNTVVTDGETTTSKSTLEDSNVTSKALVTKSTVDDSNVKSKALVTKKQLQETTMTTRKQTVRQWTSLLKDLQDEEPEVKRRKVVKHVRISAKALEKLATGITVNYRDFEVFCRHKYRAGKGEGVVPQDLSDLEDSDDDLDNISNDEDEHDLEEQFTEPIISSTPRRTSASPSPMSPDVDLPTCSSSQDSRIIGMTSTPYRPEAAPNPSFSLSEAELEEEDLCRRNVREWRSFIVPKLKSLEDKADFDIHEYGSKIIESSQIGEQRHFKDIMKGKSSAEVSRYFIATLQLANTYNVEIIGAVPGKVANDTFQIKTVDKTKHHELLEEYQAPSEETFKARLDRAQAALNVAHPSTSHGGPSSKKLKLGCYAGKRLF